MNVYAVDDNRDIYWTHGLYGSGYCWQKVWMAIVICVNKIRHGSGKQWRIFEHITMYFLHMCCFILWMKLKRQAQCSHLNGRVCSCRTLCLAMAYGLQLLKSHPASLQSVSWTLWTLRIWSCRLLWRLLDWLQCGHLNNWASVCTSWTWVARPCFLVNPWGQELHWNGRSGSWSLWWLSKAASLLKCFLQSG